MTTTERAKAALRPLAMPLIIGLVFAGPTLIAYYPPMADAPYHEAIVGLMLHASDPTFKVGEVYQWNIGHPNQAAYFIAWALALLFGSTWAIKLTVAFTQLAMPLSAAYAARKLGLRPTAVGFVAPLAMGWFFFYGFIANLLGVVVFLLTLPLLDRFSARPQKVDALKAASAFGILYFAHGSTFVVATLVLLGFSVLRYDNAKTLCLRALVLVPAWTWAIVQRGRQSSFLGATSLLRKPRPEAGSRLESLPTQLFGNHGPFFTNAIFFVALVALVIVLVLAHRGTSRGLSRRAALERHRYLAAGVLTTALYAFAPIELGNATLLPGRFLGLGWVLLSVAACPSEESEREPWGTTLGAVVVLATFFLSWPPFTESDRLYRQLDALVDRVPKGEPLYLVDMNPPEDPLLTLGGAGGHVVALRGGRVPNDFTTSHISPMYRREACDWERTETRLRNPLAAHLAFVPTFDLRRMRYLFVHVLPAARHVVARALEPFAALEGENGEWQLYRSTLEVMPICDPDPWPFMFVRWVPSLGRALIEAASDFE